MAFLMMCANIMEQRVFSIKTINILIIVILSLTVFSITERPVLAGSAAISSEKQDEVTEGQIAPDTGELPPAPEITPEERERLIRGTERLAPCNKKDDQRLTDDSSEPGSTHPKE